MEKTRVVVLKDVATGEITRLDPPVPVYIALNIEQHLRGASDMGFVRERGDQLEYEYFIPEKYLAVPKL